MNIVFIASIVNSDAGGRTFLLYGDKGFAIDPQIITPFRYVPYILLRIFSTQGFAYFQRLWTFFFIKSVFWKKFQIFILPALFILDLIVQSKLILNFFFFNFQMAKTIYSLVTSQPITIVDLLYHKSMGWVFF